MICRLSRKRTNTTLLRNYLMVLKMSLNFIYSTELGPYYILHTVSSNEMLRLIYETFLFFKFLNSYWLINYEKFRYIQSFYQSKIYSVCYLDVSICSTGMEDSEIDHARESKIAVHCNKHPPPADILCISCTLRPMERLIHLCTK